MTTEQTEREQAVEALQDALSSIGINATGTGCSQWTAQNFFAYLEARGFTIVMKDSRIADAMEEQWGDY